MSAWQRDQGLLVDASRTLGHNAYLACTGPRPDSPDNRFLIATPKDFGSPVWWKAQAPQAVVFNTWGRLAYRPWWEAAMQATPYVLERLDSDGLRSPRTGLLLYLHRSISGFKDSPYALHRKLAHLLAPTYAGFHLAVPSFLDRPFAVGLASLPLVAAESPVAAERIRRLMRKFEYTGSNITHIPHPVDQHGLPAANAVSDRENIVVSVGRWHSHQKNFPLMLKVLARFLGVNPSWRAVLPGSLPANAQHMLSRYDKRVADRMYLPGPMHHDQIVAHFSKAKIFLMTSRHESFGIAAAEALCCGCSLVGPAHIPSVPWFCGSDSGTVSTWYSANGMSDALAAEVQAWKSGLRSPGEIAKVWRKRVGAQEVVQQIIGKLEVLARGPHKDESL